MTTANLTPLFDTTNGHSWRQTHANLFPTERSLRWWWRQHQREAVARGAVVLHAGRWHAVEPNMSKLVLQIARRNARDAVEEVQ